MGASPATKSTKNHFLRRMRIARCRPKAPGSTSSARPDAQSGEASAPATAGVRENYPWADPIASIVKAPGPAAAHRQAFTDAIGWNVHGRHPPARRDRCITENADPKPAKVFAALHGDRAQPRGGARRDPTSRRDADAEIPGRRSMSQTMQSDHFPPPRRGRSIPPRWPTSVAPAVGMERVWSECGHTRPFTPMQPREVHAYERARRTWSPLRHPGAILGGRPRAAAEVIGPDAAAGGPARRTHVPLRETPP